MAATTMKNEPGIFHVTPLRRHWRRNGSGARVSQIAVR
jgi:hypothetical protein